MKERPILMSAPMVRAILAGTKTQTRRVVKPQPADHALLPSEWGKVFKRRATPDMYGNDGTLCGNVPMANGTSGELRCPYGQPGDRLWCRESLGYDAEYGHYYAATATGSLGNASGRTYLCSLFDKDGEGYSTDDTMPDRAVPSIHLPRRYSRITLEVAGVRVERLQDISADDAKAEGISEFIGGWWCEHDDAEQIAGMTPQEGYRHLWERINGPGSWDANPWVWAISFRRIKP